MKKIFLGLMVALMLVATTQAQTLQQGEPALVYYSPCTHVVLDFSYTVETYQKGMYAQYAEKLLGLSDIVEEDKTIYTLKGVKVHTRTDADLTRPHKVVAEPGVPMQLLQINEKNLLVGYNLPYEESPAKPNNTPNEPEQHKPCRKKVAPFTEDVIEARTLADEAHAVAKQIFRIREARMYLLSGEVEHAPADGQAMKLVLEELNKQEKELVELFIGTKSRVVKHKKVEYTPMGENFKLFNERLHFSPENGFTSPENVDAEEVGVTIQFTRPQTSNLAANDDQKGKKKEVQASQIVYNLPGSGLLRVRYKGELLAEKTLPMAQFGVDVPLAKDLFTGKTLPTIKISERTGNVVSISQ